MTFPIHNIINILLDDGSFVGYGSSATAWYAELLIRHLRLVTYIMVGSELASVPVWQAKIHSLNLRHIMSMPSLAALYHWSFDVSRAAVWQWDWVLFLWARNITVGWILYGGWHLFLYELPYIRSKMHPRKFNPDWPSAAQHRRDFFWTTSGLTISTMFEIFMLRAFATGRVAYYADFWTYPAWSIFQLLVVPYWRDFHFYWIHRMMHRWRTTTIPDVGQWLYTHVHSLHHKSYNTGPLSGLSMHPVEHLIYYTCTLLPFVFLLHPVHFYMNKLHADLSPISGHDGFDQPAGGSHAHFIHHALFEYNYGTPLVPFDKLFGTYYTGPPVKEKRGKNTQQSATTAPSESDLKKA